MKSYRKFILLGVFILLISSTSVFAYKLTGTKWLSSSMPVDWKIHTAGSVDVGFAATQTAIDTAYDTWQATASYITFNYAGTSSNTNWGVNNGENLIIWYESTDWGSVTGRGSGTIGVCRYWYSGGRTLDSDIAFNGQQYTWSATGEAGKMDVENVGAHEIGHFLGLSDLYSGSDTEKTMYGYSSLGQTKRRSLHYDDMNGINAICPVA